MRLALAVVAFCLALPAGANLRPRLDQGSFNRKPPQFIEKTTLTADVCNGNCGTTTWTLTITHTSSSGLKDPMLVIKYCQNQANTGGKSGMTVATIKVDGVAATQRKTWGTAQEINPANYGELWTYAGPASGSHTVLFVINSGGQTAGDRNAVASVETWACVDQLTPSANNGSATGSVSSAENFSITTAENQTVTGAIQIITQPTFTIGAGQTAIYSNLNAGGNGGNGITSSSSMKNATASTAFSYTSGNQQFAMGAISLASARR